MKLNLDLLTDLARSYGPDGNKRGVILEGGEKQTQVPNVVQPVISLCSALNPNWANPGATQTNPRSLSSCWIAEGIVAGGGAAFNQSIETFTHGVWQLWWNIKIMGTGGGLIHGSNRAAALFLLPTVGGNPQFLDIAVGRFPNGVLQTMVGSALVNLSADQLGASAGQSWQLQIQLYDPVTVGFTAYIEGAGSNCHLL